MEIEGGCYCGRLRYKATGEAFYKVLCYCRECQIFSGGGSTPIIGMPSDSFVYTQGTPDQMQRDRNPEMPGLREFCATCGTQILARSDNYPHVLSLKAGTMDHPELFGRADAAIQLAEKQLFHDIPKDALHCERWPPPAENSDS